MHGTGSRLARGAGFLAAVPEGSLYNGLVFAFKDFLGGAIDYHAHIEFVAQHGGDVIFGEGGAFGMPLAGAALEAGSHQQVGNLAVGVASGGTVFKGHPHGLGFALINHRRLMGVFRFAVAVRHGGEVVQAAAGALLFAFFGVERELVNVILVDAGEDVEQKPAVHGGEVKFGFFHRRKAYAVCP